MSDTNLTSAIPENKREAVARALQSAFGVTGVDDFHIPTGGLSAALVFRITVAERPYLLRVVPDTATSAGPGRGDQTNHFACMRAAADAGIGPRVWYANAPDGVSITDFIHAVPLPRETALVLLPELLRKLHSLPQFPSSRIVNYLDGMDRLARGLLGSGLLPADDLPRVTELYSEVLRAYPRDYNDTVPSHNDLRPENILFDGERVWLVDWEAAFANDRYLDLSVVANFTLRSDAEEAAYLRAYFGEPVSGYRRARFFLMRQLLHVFYPAFLLLIGYKGAPMEALTGAADFHEFHDRLRAGEIDLATAHAKLDYARVHLHRLLRDAETPRFTESLRTVQSRATA